MESGRTFTLSDRVIPLNRLDSIININDWELIKTQKKVEYINIPCAFDIETTSFYYNDKKCATMYIWQLAIDGKVTIGRTWEEFEEALRFISNKLELSENKRLVIYVHNLGYEFGFIQNRFNWLDVFAVKERKPVRALCDLGIEFRCSYMLSGFSLAKLSDQLIRYKVDKKVGDLDYSLMRHSGTPLSYQELMYCVYDVLVVSAYIQEKIEIDGDITRIPMTKTGYVRRKIKQNCLYSSGNHKKNKWKYVRYHKLMKTLTLVKPEYMQLKRAFMGGFTHASYMYVGKPLNNVGSIDFTSSYPYAMISERFPMSPGHIYHPKDRKDFNKQLLLYCCLFDIELTNVCASNFIDHPLSSSRCYDVKNATYDNGRIVKADSLKTTWTEQDFLIMQKYYTWDEDFKIANFRRYFKGYLPTDFVKTILGLYEAKTTLKGVEGKEAEYMSGKQDVNSAFGATVTDIFREKQIFEDGVWRTEVPNMEEELTKYNEAKGRTLFYPWGVWITAYARRNLLEGILNFGSDYIYADTDSIKALNMDKHMDYINSYNEEVERKLRRAMQHHKLDFNMCQPETIEGEKKMLGVWDFEGTYEKFKTLGAKRYMTFKNGKYGFTISGLNKKTGIPYIMSQTDNPMEYFKNDMYIPPSATGKNTHTYIDEPRDGIITDYFGNTQEFHELSCIHLEECDFTLSMSKLYMDYLLGVREEDDFN